MAQKEGCSQPQPESPWLEACLQPESLRLKCLDLEQAVETEQQQSCASSLLARSCGLGPSYAIQSCVSQQDSRILDPSCAPDPCWICTGCSSSSEPELQMRLQGQEAAGTGVQLSQRSGKKEEEAEGAAALCSVAGRGLRQPSPGHRAQSSSLLWRRPSALTRPETHSAGTSPGAPWGSSGPDWPY